MLKKIIKYFLIILSIFIGGVAIAIIFYPSTDNEILQAHYTG